MTDKQKKEKLWKVYQEMRRRYLRNVIWENARDDRLYDCYTSKRYRKKKKK